MWVCSAGSCFRKKSWESLSSEPLGSHPGPGAAGHHVSCIGCRCSVIMCMMNHALGGSDLAVLQLLNFSWDLYACSMGRSSKYSQLAEPVVTECNRMALRFGSPNFPPRMSNVDSCLDDYIAHKVELFCTCLNDPSRFQLCIHFQCIKHNCLLILDTGKIQRQI